VLCTLGFVEALKRQSGAKTVRIDYRKQTADVVWGKGRPFQYAAVKKSINGSANLIFRGLSLTARGEVTEEDGQRVLRVTGTNERFVLTEALARPAGRGAPSASSSDALPAAGQTILVIGRLSEPKHRPSTGKGSDHEQPLTLIVERFAAVATPP
jgi:hypothetical protein